MDHLYSLGVLSHDEFDEIRTLKSKPAKTTILKLLDVMQSKSDDDDVFESFLEALRQTDQLHVIHFLKTDGGKIKWIVANRLLSTGMLIEY